MDTNNNKNEMLIKNILEPLVQYVRKMVLPYIIITSVLLFITIILLIINIYVMYR
jgi:hypothetical protein